MPEASGVTPLYVLYSGLTRLAAPLVLRHVGRKLSDQGVAPERIQERAGRATLPRPDGTVIWFHGASVGESLSVLSVISHLGSMLPDVEFLITSGTAAAAEIVSKRLPPRTRHQFAPLDAPQILDRFLDHWEPAAGVFVESELWPGMLLRARDRGVRLALLNARLSQKSAQGWARYPDTARLVLGAFDLMLTQNAEIADRLRMMGADEAKLRTGANLKATADPLPVDPKTLDALKRDLEGRPFWAASSTHPGEDEIVLQAQVNILARRPEAVLLLIPRHPNRGDAILDLIQSHGLICSRRSTGTAITGDTQVYLADTLGETGTWYGAAPIVLLGGSLLPEIGGHNPFEPAQSGAAVLTGPHVANFQETFPPMIAAGAATETAGPAEIAAQVGAWLDDPDALAKARARSRAFVRAQVDQLDDVLDQLILALGLGQI